MAKQELNQRLESILGKLEELEHNMHKIHKNLSEVNQLFNTYNQEVQPNTSYNSEDANSEKRRSQKA